MCGPLEVSFALRFVRNCSARAHVFVVCADVFLVLMWEVLTEGETPFREQSPTEVAAAVSSGKLTLQLPKDVRSASPDLFSRLASLRGVHISSDHMDRCPAALEEVFKLCFTFKMDQRPGMSDVLARLQAIASSLSPAELAAPLRQKSAPASAPTLTLSTQSVATAVASSNANYYYTVQSPITYSSSPTDKTQQ
jgi:hypothetical protein